MQNSPHIHHFITHCILSAALLCCRSKRPRVRVRKELRSLNQAEVSLLVSGLSTMLSVPTAEGQALYGKQYKAYDYFIVKHAVSVNDPRGDQVGDAAASDT